MFVFKAFEYCKSLYFRIFSILRLKTYSEKLKFTLQDAFLCKLHNSTYFERLLNSRRIKFTNISENKLLANNIEFTLAKDLKLLADSKYLSEFIDELADRNLFLHTHHVKRSQLSYPHCSLTDFQAVNQFFRQ